MSPRWYRRITAFVAAIHKWCSFCGKRKIHRRHCVFKLSVHSCSAHLRSSNYRVPVLLNSLWLHRWCCWSFFKMVNFLFIVYSNSFPCSISEKSTKRWQTNWTMRNNSCLQGHTMLLVGRKTNRPLRIWDLIENAHYSILYPNMIGEFEMYNYNKRCSS